jgi:hypothetical protein
MPSPHYTPPGTALSPSSHHLPPFHALTTLNASFNPPVSPSSAPTPSEPPISLAHPSSLPHEDRRPPRVAALPPPRGANGSQGIPETARPTRVCGQAPRGERRVTIPCGWRTSGLGGWVSCPLHAPIRGVLKAVDGWVMDGSARSLRNSPDRRAQQVESSCARSLRCRWRTAATMRVVSWALDVCGWMPTGLEWKRLDADSP